MSTLLDSLLIIAILFTKIASRLRYLFVSQEMLMSHSRFLSLGLFFLCFQAFNAEAQGLDSCKDGGLSPKTYENRPYFDPLSASLLEAQSSLFFGLSDPFPYMEKTGKHKTMLASVGLEVPIIVWDGFKVDENNRNANRDLPIGKGCFGFGFWLSPGFHTALDFNEDGQPIVDIDFRVAMAMKLAYGLSSRDRLGVRFGVCHESSHLTIDFAYSAIAHFPNKFKDIDVNYECFEASLNLDRDYPWGTLSLRGGSMFAMNRVHKGFYSSNGVTLMPSKRNYEPYVGLQYMPKKTVGWGGYLSYTIYALPTYNYDRITPNQAEAIRLSQTGVLGLRDFGKGRGVPDFVFKCYVGRNPYGPLRNDNTWKSCQAGITLR